MEIINRQANHNYYIMEKYEAGIVLSGTEIKGIRAGKCNIKDSYGVIKHYEAYLLNMYIAPYEQASIFNQEERRTRKLLLNKKEILKLNDKISQEGYTLIPLKIYFKKDKAKVELGLCKGKHTYDKKQSLKEKDIKRELDKESKKIL